VAEELAGTLTLSGRADGRPGRTNPQAKPPNRIDKFLEAWFIRCMAFFTLPLRGWIFLAGFAPVLTAQDFTWSEVRCDGLPHARHEAGFVACGDHLYLLGGRGEKPVERFDPRSSRWEKAADPPMEIHHFQAVVWRDRIYLPGAMTGGFPRETPLDHIPIYEPATRSWARGPEVPEGRRRGGAGAVVVGDHLYIVAGIVDGHMGGYVPWLDRVDLVTGEWTVLDDAPHARDHFHAVLLENKIYAAGGRTTSHATGELFSLLVAPVDVYDLATGTWSTLPEPLPTPRAGNAAVAAAGRLLVVGGESHTQGEAHDEVEAFDPHHARWETLPSLVTGRHGSGVAVWGGRLWIASGSGGRGGGPELTTVESAPLP
jgi:hypothetical protein